MNKETNSWMNKGGMKNKGKGKERINEKIIKYRINRTGLLWTRWIKKWMNKYRNEEKMNKCINALNLLKPMAYSQIQWIPDIWIHRKSFS